MTMCTLMVYVVIHFVNTDIGISQNFTRVLKIVMSASPTQQPARSVTRGPKGDNS